MKILVFSQHLFPIKTPRAHRTTELVKELARRGHSVVLYAVLGKHDYAPFEKETGVRVKQIPIFYQIHPYSSDGDGRRTFIDKVTGRLFGRLFEFPYIEFMYAIPRIIRAEQKFDALISISDPHHIHWGCARAKHLFPKKFPDLWIADAGDPFMENGRNTSHAARFAKYEHWFCSSCNYLTVPIANAIDGYYTEYHSKIKIIPQGFNFDLPIVTPNPQNKIVRFAFAGAFFKDYRNPAQFLDYLAKSPKEFNFVVFTQYRDLIEPFLSALGKRIEIVAPIPRHELLEQLRTMDFLVNIENSNSPNQLPSKLIDYAIAARPILSVNPTNINTLVIDQFLDRNYENAFVVENLEQYHISSVGQKFEDLLSTHLSNTCQNQ